MSPAKEGGLGGSAVYVQVARADALRSQVIAVPSVFPRPFLLVVASLMPSSPCGQFADRMKIRFVAKRLTEARLMKCQTDAQFTASLPTSALGAAPGSASGRMSARLTKKNAASSRVVLGRTQKSSFGDSQEL